MAEKSHGRWYVDLRSGEAKPCTMKPGVRAWVTHAILVDHASTAAGQSVSVAIRNKTRDEQIRLVLSAERPVAPVRSMVMIEDGFCMEREVDDSANAVVRFEGGYVVDAPATPETETVEDRVDQEAVLEDDDAEAVEDSEDQDEMVQENGCWYVDLRSGETKMLALKPGQRAWVSHAELVHPASAPAGQTMRVVLRTKTDVESLELCAERNVVMVRSTVMMDDEFWLEREEDNCTDMVVRFIVCDGNVHAIPSTGMVDHVYEEEDGEDQDEEDDDGEASDFENDEDEEMVEGTMYEVTDTEESDDGYEISDDEEESDDESKVDGIMRVAAADEENGNQEGGGDRQLMVLYRYTRFRAAGSDGSVEASGCTKEHQLRFITAGVHGARSLAWAGASLADLIYPDGSSKKLRELWTRLASHVRLPPGAACVKVFVDVGLLQQEDCTEAGKMHMRASLNEMMAQPWPTRFVGMELNLPEPVLCGHDEDKAAHDMDMDGEQKPAKRRRVVATEKDCGVCLQMLKGDDLAAWPGCDKPHVFHGHCLEGVLESNPVCPFCRRGLYIE